MLRLFFSCWVFALSGCYDHYECIDVENRMVGLDEVTPLGFTPNEAAAALAVVESIPIEYVDGSGSSVLTAALQPNVVEVLDPRGERPSLPRYIERARDDGLDTDDCGPPHVELGYATVRVTTADGLIDQEMLTSLTIWGPLEGSEVWFSAWAYDMAETGGTWEPPYYSSAYFEARFRVEETADGPTARLFYVRIGSDNSGPDGGGTMTPFISYGEL